MLSIPGCPYTRNNQINMFGNLLWRFHMSLSAFHPENEKTHVYTLRPRQMGPITDDTFKYICLNVVSLNKL